MANSQPTQQKDTTVRVPWELLERLKVIARAHDRSLVAEVRVALTGYADRIEKEQERKAAKRDGS